MSNETGSPENTMVEPKTDPKQITFKLNTQSVLLWRRTFLLRYFLNLGEYHNTDVKWTDYDTKNHRLELNDEQAPFKWSIPHGSLYKSVTQITVEGKKLITITLFYTTENCLVQGNVTQDWVKSEFELLNKKLSDTS